MPDLQTALSKAINEWETAPAAQPKETTTMRTPFAITNNVSRATFNYVRDNPGARYRDILAALVAQGYKEHSVTALLSQMRRGGTISCDEARRYTAVVSEYMTPKFSKRSKMSKSPKTAKAVKTVKATTAVNVATPDPVPAPGLRAAPTTKPIQLVRMTSAEEILNTLPIKQARELYDVLHTIFGGRT